MTTLWTSADAEAATGGRTTHPWNAGGVSIDSRTVRDGDLFVALKGPHHDGHDHVMDAFGRGAAAAMVHRVRPDEIAGGPLLTVTDTLKGLEKLATAARGRSDARIVAVTGSVGKTGVKEALLLVLGRQAETQANAGNLNNHWGAPLSLARFAPSARYGIFELGMNHPGEIAPLSRLVRPHVAVVTTIAPAHAAHFASVEEIADAKAEIFEGVAPDGTAVLNRDNPFYDRLATAARRHGIARLVSFGEHDEAEARLVSARHQPTCSTVEADIGGQRLSYRIGAPGRHWVVNSLAVLATVHALGADLERAASSLAEMRAPGGRGRQLRVARDDGSFTLIDESYNASPAAVRAALEVLSLSQPAQGGRRIAILGDMLELGAESADLHAGLAEAIGDSGIDLVYAAGADMVHLYRALPAAKRGGHAENTAALLPVIASVVRPGDVVLVKGSLGMNMARIVRALLPDGAEG